MRIVTEATRRWDGRYELRFQYNRNLIEALKAEIPAAYREYEPDTKTWIIDGPYAVTAIQMLRTVFPDATINGREETASQPPPMHRSNPHARLYVLPNAPRCVVEAAYKALVKELHPDRAPAEQRDQAHDLMVALNEAYAVLRDRVAQ